MREKRILTPDQLQRLVKELAEPYATIVKFAALTGLRKGEIEGLRWRNVHPHGIRVEEAVHRGQLGSPKTRSSRRTVAIGKAIRNDLDHWRGSTKFPSPDAFVFAVRTNTPIDLHNTAARYLKPAARRAGTPPASWHDLRHTYATWSRMAGVSAESLRDQLGHSSIQTTLDVYSHADNRDSAAESLELYALGAKPRR